MKRTILSIPLCLTICLAYGQIPKVKKETKIVFSYWEELVGIDTFVIEYQLNGWPRGESDVSILFNDSIKTIDSTASLIHKRVFQSLHGGGIGSSDSGYRIIDIYIRNYTDSVLEVGRVGLDTIYLFKEFFSNGKLIKSLYQDSSGSFNLRLYDKKKKYSQRCVIVNSYYKGDTFKLTKSWLGSSKLWEFNEDKKEWFVKEKRKVRKRKKVILEKHYHDYHEKYFTTRTTTLYNKYGLPVSEIKFDTDLNEVIWKVLYKYEYY